jgi:hypothetical protein
MMIGGVDNELYSIAFGETEQEITRQGFGRRNAAAT